MPALSESPTVIDNTQLQEAVRQVLAEEFTGWLKRLDERAKPSLGQLFSIQTIAQETTLDEKLIRRAIKSGELPALNIASGGAKKPTYRVSQASLDSWLQSKLVRTVPLSAERDALVDIHFGKNWKSR